MAGILALRGGGIANLGGREVDHLAADDGAVFPRQRHVSGGSDSSSGYQKKQIANVNGHTDYTDDFLRRFVRHRDDDVKYIDPGQGIETDVLNDHLAGDTLLENFDATRVRRPAQSRWV